MAWRCSAGEYPVAELFDGVPKVVDPGAVHDELRPPLGDHTVVPRLRFLGHGPRLHWSTDLGPRSFVPTADELLNAAAVLALAKCLSPAPKTRKAASRLDGLGLRERSDLVRDALLNDLPKDYAAFGQAVRAALADPEFTGWMIWPVTSATSARALEDGSGEAFDSALALLADLTPRLTAEFGIRPLLDADLGRALPIVLTWTKHPDEHVRRLASEGTRPLLPWAKRVRAIIEDPAATVPVLDVLHRDESEYVRRSVANHLNDISRRDPDLAAAVASRWLQADPGTLPLVRHAMRTLIKQGHPEALALLGFAPPDGLTVDGPELDARHRRDRGRPALRLHAREHRHRARQVGHRLRDPPPQGERQDHTEGLQAHHQDAVAGRTGDRGSRPLVQGDQHARLLPRRPLHRPAGERQDLRPDPVHRVGRTDIRPITS
jgi:3-methyladenine DNA glycosylase AlkC